IKASSGLSDEEVERMIKDAEAHAEEDKKFQQLVGTRNGADSLIHTVKKTMADLGDEKVGEDKAKIEAAIAELETAIRGDDVAEIEQKTQALAEASHKLAEQMYAQQQPAGGAAA